MNRLVLHVDALPACLSRQGMLLRNIRYAAAALCIAGFGATGSQAIATETPDNPVGDNAAVDADPAQLIESMSRALRTLNYEGVFVHAQGANMTSMHILHANIEQQEFERLRSLDGEAREVIRNDSLVTCIWPGSKSVEISRAKPRDLLPGIDSRLAANPRYEFALGMADRVAGRPTQVVNVTPLDEYRYGYRFWIDTDTSMLLRSMLLQRGNYPIEQVIFTHIDYLDSIDISRFDINHNDSRGEPVSWLEPEKHKARTGLENQHSETANRVTFSTLPDGYRKVSETFSSLDANSSPMSHVMLSDGMASVSVYVEYFDDGERSAAVLGLSRMGAMNAFGIGSDSVHITAVGEVPEATVRAIAAAVILDQ